jgi:hypothetical protein
MPAARQWRTASGTPARSGSARPTRPRKSKANSRCVTVDHAPHRRPLLVIQAAEISDGLRSALRRDDVLVAGRAGDLPHLRHRQQFRVKRIRADECLPRARHGIGARQHLVRQVVKGLLHRVERIDRAGERAEGDHVAKALRHRGAGRLARPAGRAIGQAEFRDGHAVLGERAGLVGAQHGCRAERFDGRGAPREHARARDAPGAHREEHGEDDREFFRQHRHAERNAAEQRVQPSAAPQAVEQHGHDAHRAADEAEEAHQPAGLHLQPRRLGVDGLQGLADLPDLAAGTNRGHFPDAGAAHDQRAGEDVRKIVAARPRRRRRRLCRPGDLADRDRLPRQQRLVDLQIAALDEHGVGRDAIALGQDDEIAANDLAPGDARALPVADHERARAAQVAQRLEHALGARFLHDRDEDGHRGERDEHDRFLQAADDQVDDAAAEQEREHGLAQHVGDDAPDGAAAAAGEFVVALGLQARLDVSGVEAAERGAGGWPGGHGARVYRELIAGHNACRRGERPIPVRGAPTACRP